jgi:hypothetical protein
MGCSHKAPVPAGTAPEAVTSRSENPALSNVVVTVHQSTINDLLTAVGPIQGTGFLLPKSNSFSFGWSLAEPRVEIFPDSLVFRAILEFRLMGTTYRSPAWSRGAVSYDSLEQRLYLQIGEITIEKEPRFLGMKIPVNKINLAAFAGKGIGILSHLPLEASFLVKKPQDEKKSVRFEVVNHQINYIKDQVEVKLNFRFRGDSIATKPNSGASKF